MNFRLSEEEETSANEFMGGVDHLECRKTYVGAIGGHFSYTFYPTSIGTAVHIKCEICKKKKGISDYMW